MIKAMPREVTKLALEAINYFNALNNINSTLIKLGSPPLAVTFAYSPLNAISGFIPLSLLNDIS